MASKGSDDNGVVFSKDEAQFMNADEIWDDTALIEMYEESIKKAYKKLGVQQETSTSDSDGSKERIRKWRIGDQCLAPYYDDNLWYPAVIKRIASSGDRCTVVYDEYEETASVKLSELNPRDNDSEVSEGSSLRNFGKSPKTGNNKKNMRRTDSNKNVDLPGSSQAMLKSIRSNALNNTAVPPETTLPRVIPPPPPMFSSIVDPTDEEAISNMLLSWYMCGYHTGYYQALHNEKKKQNPSSD